MYYIKLDENRNFTVLEYSKEPITEFSMGQTTGTTDFNFPTSQPAIFYRMEMVGFTIVPNDEETIKSYREEEGVMAGLDLEPHIDKVPNGEFLPNTTRVVTIEGVNFSPFSTVEVSGQGNFVNTTNFISPLKIEAEVTVGIEEGIFNLKVRNDELHSQTSGDKMIVVKSKTIIDLRTYDYSLLGIEATSNINITQDAQKGMRLTSNTNSWNRGVKFSANSWNREEDITFEVVFCREASSLFMIGLASIALNVTSINAAYYKQEIGMYHNNTLVNTMYGGGDVTNWSQNIGANVIIDRDKCYKLKLDYSGRAGYECALSEVDPNDWDDEEIIHKWVSNCPADDDIVCPFILPQASAGAYNIVGFRY